MGKYLKKFETQAAYDAAYPNLILPNVSLIADNNTVHYNSSTPTPAETRIVAKFNVTDTSSSTRLCGWGRSNLFSYIEIDGVTQSSVVDYTFDTPGEHTVKYTLEDPTSIGNSAFEDCSSLTSIVIPDSVTSIGNSAFAWCGGLTSCTIGSGVTSIGDSAFNGCSSLTSIDIPNSVISIGTQAFNGCSSITSCTIGSSVTSIGNYAFYYCYGITSIVIPDSVTSIGDLAFNRCTSLTSITVDSSNTNYSSEDGVLFNKAKTTLIQYPIGNSRTSYTIPNSITSMGTSSFLGCTNITSIVIPSGVTSIGNSAFNGCSSLTSIACNATAAPTIQSYTFAEVKTGGTLTVPAGSTGYDVWMGTGDYYLGKYNWTKVEQ